MTSLGEQHILVLFIDRTIVSSTLLDSHRHDRARTINTLKPQPPTASAAPACVPLIIGPTASGKSALAVEVALRLGQVAQANHPAEIIAADAFQIYRGMNIGTAKPTAQERSGVPHHVIDVADPHQPVGEGTSSKGYTVSDWLADAQRAINDVRAQAKTPIVCGGTSLYIQSLLRGLFDGPPADEALRAELHALEPAQLRRELEQIDPAAAERIHPNDLRRTVRAIEVFRLTAKPISLLQTQWEQEPPAASPFRVFVLTWEPDALNRRINARVKDMMERGLLDEVCSLSARGELNAQAREALGYKQLLAHLADPGRCSLDDAVEKIKIETRRFAKNQRTWMKRLANNGISIPGEQPTDRQAEEICQRIGVIASLNRESAPKV